MADVNKMIGDMIRKVRLDNNLTQKQLGRMIGLDEDSAQPYIYKYEKGIIKIPAEVLFKMAFALKIHTSSFFPLISSDSISLDDLIELSISAKVQKKPDQPADES